MTSAQTMTKIVPGTSFPTIDVPLVGGKTTTLGATDNPENWKLVVVYRGKHCPLCTRYLTELDQLYPDFLANGTEVVAVSADPKDKAEFRVHESNLSFPVAYDLSIHQMQQLGLYISDPASPEETDRPFPEPGIFAINPEGIVQVVDISNAPFVRPDLSSLKWGLEYIRQPGEKRQDPFGGSRYPIRGTHRPD